jgi:AraC-like DNA-binding protein
MQGTAVRRLRARAAPKCVRRGRPPGRGGTGLMPLPQEKGHRSLSLSTDDVPAEERRAYWEACVARFHLATRIDPMEGTPFRASVEANSLHDVTLARSSTTAQRGRRAALGPGAAEEERCLLLINLAGTIHLRHAEREVTLGRHDMIVIDSRLPSEYSMPEGATTLSLNMPRQALVERLPGHADFAAAKLPADRPMQPMTIGFFSNLFETFGRKAAELRSATSLRLAGHAIDHLGIALGDMLETPAPASPYRAALLGRIKDFVEAQLHEPLLGVQMVAAKYRISARYIAMLFREEGTTFSDFMRQRRLERARRQLEALDATARQIGEIALAVGFVSQAHFSRLFREAYQTTPRQYRSAFDHRLALPRDQKGLTGGESEAC